MIDLLKFVYPNASPAELTQISNFCVFLGWVIVCLGLLGTVVESIGQMKLIYEGFPLILMGFFFIIPMGMHSSASLFSFFYNTQIIIPIV